MDWLCLRLCLLDKPYSNGQWTQARFNSFITSLLRAGTMRWQPKNQCIKNARTRRGWYRCTGCNEEVPATLPPKEGNKRRIKNILADHVCPIVDPAVGFVSWDEWISRAFVELDGYQALCHNCHTEKTQQERIIANNRKKK